MTVSRLIAASLTALAVALPPADAGARTKKTMVEDPHLWLEEIEGEKAIAWVKAENSRSLAELETDPRFKPMYEEAKSILTSTARVPDGEINAGYVYNFWQDGEQVRGLWRRADVKSFRKGAPKWEPLIDFDKLAKDEGENWIHGDIVCLGPQWRHCMIELSKGGKDAAYWREFDLQSKSFVDGGFTLGEAKSGLAWIDKDTLLVGTDFGAGALTDSGYPRILKIWRRGAALGDAPIFFEGDAKDVAVWPRVEQADRGAPHLFAQRSVTFFETELQHQQGVDGARKALPLPRNADLNGVIGGRAVFTLREPWAYQQANYANGAVVAFDLANGAAERVTAPTEVQSIEDVEVGKSGLIIQYLDNVSGKAARAVRGKDGAWSLKEIPLPENGVVKIVSAGGGTDDALISFESMTTPDSLYYLGEKNKLTKIFEAPAYYDAKDVVVEQRFATSTDGTRIPFFVMAKKGVLEKGGAPTIQYGYGGFLAPMLPVYYEDPARPQHGALAGKLWVERGGVLVISNIRGGSEYGPKWHQAALKENRQRSFDDFFAIGDELIRSGVAAPGKLGAIGRSNGGLLMGAALTQRPDLYAAIDIGVPLFDMKRYNKLLAGASWMAEYGDPDIPAEWAYISKYSPYQNLKKDAAYPKVLFYTSTKDDRVHPGHARKAAARLKEYGHPFYYYENIEGGHGGTANQDQLAYRTAIEFGYFAKMLMGE